MLSRTLLTAINFAFVFIFTMVVLRRRRRATAATLAWILTFFLLPYLGVLIYMLLGFRDFERRRQRKPNLSKKSALAQLTQTQALADPEMLDPDFVKLSKLGLRLTEFPVIAGNQVTLLEEAFATYRELSEAIQGAKHHVHMEYYIFEPDETGRYFRDLLIQKAREGVECRLLVDHIGSWRLDKKFIAPLEEAGVRFAQFWPVHISRPWGFHLRNHRKLVVVDGSIGFIGSQNIGNEYLQWNHRGLSWRDSHVKIEGPAVAQLQTIFLEDWDFTTGESFPHPEYFRALPRLGTSHVQALPTGPDEQDSSLELILVTLLAGANRRVTLITPYLIPSHPILVAMEAAAMRGVKIDILVPRKSDQWVVDRASKSWYRDLLSSGAEIHEYAKTFLHAKVITMDDRAALIGSANMDERSFRLNFECSLMIYDNASTTRLLASFDSMRAESAAVSLKKIDQQFFLKDVRDGFFRVLSPLL